MFRMQIFQLLQFSLELFHFKAPRLPNVRQIFSIQRAEDPLVLVQYFPVGNAL